MNTGAEAAPLVRLGNERVLRARFNDARFFWNFDQQKPARKPRGRTGSRHLAGATGLLPRQDAADGRSGAGLGRIGVRAARRSSVQVRFDYRDGQEFTELQGVVGGLYAARRGAEEVWRAIYEHYKPVSMEDSIPATPSGRIVALADKLDTLRGCFGIGLIPSGSKDPFALRRAAQESSRSSSRARWRFRCPRCWAGDKQLEEFLLDASATTSRDLRGFAYDEVNAVLAAGANDLVDVESRLLAIRAVRPTENFEPLAASFKRIRNILRQADFKGGGRSTRSCSNRGRKRICTTCFVATRTVLLLSDYKEHPRWDLARSPAFGPCRPVLRQGAGQCAG